MAVMKKLLLLTIFPLTAFLSSFAGKLQQGEKITIQSYKDSIIKGEILNPKAGFKNLFDTDASTAGFAIKLNPQAMSFVEDYMDQQTNRLTKMKTWGKRYFDVMDNILSSHGLPTELKYLSVIESDLKSYAVSWAGAVGPWQFMPETGRRMGLRISRYSDERTDFYKSTHAASKYLTHLYGLYNDWLLVIAAYNGGPGNVNSAIRKSGSRNFWNLQYFLPAESRNHVKKFIATHYIMEGNGSITTLTKNERTDQLLNQEPTNTPAFETLSISGKYNSLVIAQHIQMDIASFNRLNPRFDKQLSTTGSYELKLPADKLLLFQANKPQILEQSIRLMLMTATKPY
jgi:membrane-bound lytic murein transglycosylase D